MVGFVQKVRVAPTIAMQMMGGDGWKIDPPRVERITPDEKSKRRKASKAARAARRKK